MSRSTPSSRSSGSVTLSDVAKLAGVSPITVSRVLNRPELVTPDTMEVVREAIARTGYVPNMLAGGLASKRSRLVAALFPTIASSMFAETMEALTDRLGEAGYQVLLGLSGYPAAREDDLLEAILSRRPDGILLTGIIHSPATRQKLLAAKIPVVEIWDYTPTPIDMLVGFSHEKVGEAVADYLFGKGYRRFAMIGADDDRAAQRQKGFLSALARHGIGDVPTITVSAPGSLRTGREGMARLLNEGQHPDADLLQFGRAGAGRPGRSFNHAACPSPETSRSWGSAIWISRHTPSPRSRRSGSTGAASAASPPKPCWRRMEGRTDMEKVLDTGFEVIERAST